MQAIFTYVLYPALIILIIAALAVSIIGVLFTANTGRRFVAALLPFVRLVFWIAARPATEALFLSDWLGKFPFLPQLGIGLGTGFLAMLLTQVGIRSAVEAGAMIALIILSSLACVLMLFLFDGVLSSLRGFSLGIILGLGLFIVLLGFPGARRAGKPAAK